jgi:hypothetical protein
MAAFATPTYNKNDLGEPAGGLSSTEVYATGVNNVGVVSGYYQLSGGNPIAVIWWSNGSGGYSSSNVRSLGNPGAGCTGCYATAISPAVPDGNGNWIAYVAGYATFAHTNPGNISHNYVCIWKITSTNQYIWSGANATITPSYDELVTITGVANQSVIISAVNNTGTTGQAFGTTITGILSSTRHNHAFSPSGSTITDGGIMAPPIGESDAGTGDAGTWVNNDSTPFYIGNRVDGLGNLRGLYFPSGSSTFSDLEAGTWLSGANDYDPIGCSDTISGTIYIVGSYHLDGNPWVATYWTYSSGSLAAGNMAFSVAAGFTGWAGTYATAMATNKDICGYATVGTSSVATFRPWSGDLDDLNSLISGGTGIDYLNSTGIAYDGTNLLDYVAVQAVNGSGIHRGYVITYG